VLKEAVLKELLQDIGLVGTDLDEGVTSLMGSPISNVVSWIDSHMHESNSFPTALSVNENHDIIPDSTVADEFSGSHLSQSNLSLHHEQRRAELGVGFQASPSPTHEDREDWTYDDPPEPNVMGSDKLSPYHEGMATRSPPDMMFNPQRLDHGLLSIRIDSDDDEDVSLAGRNDESSPFFSRKPYQLPKNEEKGDIKSPTPSEPSGEVGWIDWVDALLDVSNSEWFERSLHLICLMCCNNTRAQRETTHLLPPELLMYLLHLQKLSAQNKTLICQLLRNIYIQNNLVFSSRPTEKCPIFVCGQNSNSKSRPLVSNTLLNYSRIPYTRPAPNSSPDVESGNGKVYFHIYI
jgi:hypothetical protein